MRFVIIGNGAAGNAAARAILDAVLLNRHLGEADVRSVISELMRTDPTDRLAFLSATEAPAETVLGVQSQLAPASIIRRFDEAIEQRAYKVSVRLWEFWRDTATPGTYPVLELVHPMTDRLNLGGAVAFQGFRPAFTLNREETLGYNLAIGAARRFSLDVADGDRMFTVHVLRTRSIHSAETAGAKTRLRVRLDVSGIVWQDESRGARPVSQAELDRYERVMEKFLEGEVTAAVRRAQAARIDIFGFGQRLWWHNPSQRARIRTRWPNEFANAQLDVQVRVSLTQKGGLV
ncbi:MAG: Ger(x)C family spore germination C-terminal domain-containing protein [Alicyclobacillus sp.]|nr:Ger(x)C family spore germination C-terminal domain-containing protein [Alicyclobacillus sp.]